ncbi:GGDEF domain-containing protein [Bosea sp. 117]|uniref:GGDEF domain-containing protein n=1 Tax=Bosea sp. 117 TaxID=1125973 RepID=UPI00068AD84E|nr:GGDEF domain-containing protein [Bosea sp. 117]
MTPLRLFTLLNPAIGIVFATVFLLLWLNQRNRPYILLMSGASAAYALAVTAQITIPPMPRVGLNTMVSAVLYQSAIGLFVEAMLTRVGLVDNRRWILAISAVILGAIAYFFYVHDSLSTRIYVQNLGAGAMLCFAALRLRTAPARKPIDRVLFWVVLLTGLHFLPRTILTMLVDVPAGMITPENFARSLFYSLLSFALVILALLLCLTFLLAVALDVVDDLRRDRNEDSLTPLLNRRGFEEEAGRRLAGLHGAPAALIYCDIDRFKAINDSYGHAAGDEVIRAVGELVAGELGREDCAARIGGEEFVILLARGGLDEARALAERLRLRIGELRLGAVKESALTASFGIAEARPDEPLDAVMERADEMLYRAKRGGRNQVRA